MSTLRYYGETDIVFSGSPRGVPPLAMTRGDGWYATGEKRKVGRPVVSIKNPCAFSEATGLPTSRLTLVIASGAKQSSLNAHDRTTRVPLVVSSGSPRGAPPLAMTRQEETTLPPALRATAGAAIGSSACPMRHCERSEAIQSKRSR